MDTFGREANGDEDRHAGDEPERNVLQVRVVNHHAEHDAGHEKCQQGDQTETRYATIKVRSAVGTYSN